jgi:hypothetical protein
LNSFYGFCKNPERERARFSPHLKMLLYFTRVEVSPLWVHSGCGEVEALVHVGEEKGGADAGLVMQAGAAIAMAASADLEVEGAVDAILLSAEDGSQVLRHGSLVRFAVLCTLKKKTSGRRRSFSEGKKLLEDPQCSR